MAYTIMYYSIQMIKHTRSAYCPATTHRILKPIFSNAKMTNFINNDYFTAFHHFAFKAMMIPSSVQHSLLHMIHMIDIWSSGLSVLVREVVPISRRRSG